MAAIRRSAVADYGLTIGGNVDSALVKKHEIPL
jgi:hypothetical protein